MNFFGEMNIHSPSEDINPFEFQCDHCRRSRVFTESEIEKEKKEIPENKGNFFLLCSFCKIGHMKPPIFVQFFSSDN